MLGSHPCSRSSGSNDPARQPRYARRLAGSARRSRASRLALIVAVAPAAAVTFSNPATITVPDPNCTDPEPSSPYPSNIVVSGRTGTVSDVNVTLNDVTHPFEGDFEVLLVSPAGAPATSRCSPTPAPAPCPTPPSPSTMRPPAWPPRTRHGGPAPTSRPTHRVRTRQIPGAGAGPSSNTTLAGLQRHRPNGTWSLYVVDDGCPDAGSIAAAGPSTSRPVGAARPPPSARRPTRRRPARTSPSPRPSPPRAAR